MASVGPGSARLREVTARRRTMDDWLVVALPRLSRALVGAGWLLVKRMSPRSRVRRALLIRLCLRTYGAFNRRDLPVFLGLFHPDVVYDTSHVAGWPEKRIYHGYEGLTEMANDWFATWDFWLELEDVRDLGGNRCLVMADDRMTGAASGVALQSVLWTQVATVRNGLCIRVDNYTDRREALDAVGLDEQPPSA
jgi:ketosteroid isomerase-like protein